MISRVDGGILVLGLMALMIFLVIDSRTHIRQGANGSGQLVPGESADALQDSQLRNGGLSTRKNFLYLVGGMIGLTLGARLMVGSAVEIANILSIHPVVVGLTIVAVGTSLPELAASVVCAMKGERREVANINGYSFRSVSALMTKGSRTALTPRMRAMLAILEPIMLPMARASSPTRTAKKLRTNSGIEVPIATTVRPMTMGRMPN